MSLDGTSAPLRNAEVMHSFSKDEIEQQLPRCAACLQDFDLYQYPCQFVCKHIYCTLCLKRLKDSGDVYKCLYDETLTPVIAAKSDIGFYNRIDYFRRFVLARAEVSAELVTQLDQLKTEMNFVHVACRNLLESPSCPFFAKCPYDHSIKSIAIARKFRATDLDSCWECKRCQLTVSRKLMRCPVCESEQEAPQTPKIIYSPLFRSSNRREFRKVTNATLDLSSIAEDDRHRLKAVESDQSSALPQVLENSTVRQEGNDQAEGNDQGEDAPVVVKTSRCCQLQ